MNSKPNTRSDTRSNISPDTKQDRPNAPSAWREWASLMVYGSMLTLLLGLALWPESDIHGEDQAAPSEKESAEAKKAPPQPPQPLHPPEPKEPLIATIALHSGLQGFQTLEIPQKAQEVLLKHSDGRSCRYRVTFYRSKPQAQIPSVTFEARKDFRRCKEEHLPKNLQGTASLNEDDKGSVRLYGKQALIQSAITQIQGDLP